MALSVKERLAALPAPAREQFLAGLPPEVLTEMARGEWWYTARPEQIPPAGRIFIYLYMAGRGAGKAVALSTLVPTPYGKRPPTPSIKIPGVGEFVKIGDLEVGSWVFDEQGKPCRVTAVFDSVPDSAYRLTFSDGMTIDACSEHQWVTWEHRDRKAFLRSEYEEDTSCFPGDWLSWRPLKSWHGREPFRDETGPGPRIRTTEDIAKSLTHGKRADLNHCIPLAGSLQLPEVRLPIDPWVLGYWLGNGSTGTGSITGHAADAKHVEAKLLEAGFRIRMAPRPGSFLGTPYGLVQLLREMEVLGHKHVPGAYLWASEKQRQELLAGLMDSDGYGDLRNKKPSVEFCSITRELADAVVQLARSLGQKPVLHEGRAKLYGVDKGAKYRVCWRPTFNPFTSPRKAATYLPLDDQGLRSRHRMITNVEEIDPIPMRCITVDSPHSMYLLTEALIPTHNSRAGSEWVADQVCKHPFDRHEVPTEWLVVADTLADARTINAEGPSGLLNVLRRRGIEHRYKQSPRPMVLLPKGARVYFLGADTADCGRGFNAAGILCDEIAKWEHPYDTWFEGLLPALRADLVDDIPRAFVTTTPKPIKLLVEWLARDDGGVHVITGSTFDNASNLSPTILAELRRQYAGTALGEQELYGKLLELSEGGLFRRLDIAKNRVGVENSDPVPDEFISVVAGVDPNLTGLEALTGIVVVARTRDNHLYVLADRSTQSSGRDAALAIWRTVADYAVDVVVYEENLGKRYLKEVLQDSYAECVELGMFPRGSSAPLKPVHAKHGKKTRAEPVALRNEQGRLHIVGHLDELENQCVLFDPVSTRESPDRLDALVHAALHLIAGERKQMRVSDPGRYAINLDQSVYDLSRLL